ncbi:MAG: L,D-transpeptidase [Kofleriaceae bacterium]
MRGLGLPLSALLLLGGCGGDRAPTGAAPEADSQPLPSLAPKPPPPPPPAFPAGTRSLRLTRTVGVRLGPAGDAKRIGTIAQDTRVRWQRTAAGPGCSEVWVELEPRGWVCADQLEASTRAAHGVELPRLDRGEVMPGVYGKIIDAGATTYTLDDPRASKGKKKKPAAKPAPPPPPPPPPEAAAPDDGPVAAPSEVEPEVDPLGRTMTPGRPLVGSLNVRRYGEITIAGKAYWKISPRDNEWVLASSVRQHRPSGYDGVRLGDDTGLTLPIAFVWPRSGTKTWTRASATGGASRHQVAQRDALPVLETHADGAGKALAYRVGPGEWIAADAVRLVEAQPPPALIGPHERWIDVDADREILVAYEGTLPVFATLVSGGKRDTPTERGLYRLWKKVSETDMNGLSGEDPYSVATVPWTQFYNPERGLALHAAYWHDGFGLPRSHGCVNLAPKVARWLYTWSEPSVPPGWTMAAGVVEAPGSIIRVRGKDTPELPWRGYGKQVQELRQATGAPR